MKTTTKRTKKPQAIDMLGFIERQRNDFATKEGLTAVKDRLSDKIDAVKDQLSDKIEAGKNDIRWLKWIVGVGFTGLLTVMLYLHSDTGRRIDRIEGDLKEINNKIKLTNTEKTIGDQ